MPGAHEGHGWIVFTDSIAPAMQMLDQIEMSAEVDLAPDQDGAPMVAGLVALIGRAEDLTLAALQDTVLTEPNDRQPRDIMERLMGAFRTMLGACTAGGASPQDALDTVYVQASRAKECLRRLDVHWREVTAARHTAG